MKTVAVFPYRVAIDSDLGIVSSVILRLELVGGPIALPARAIFDSGADITVLPYRVGRYLGLSDVGGGELRFSGVGGGRFSLRVRRLGLRIGESRVVQIRVGWVEANDTGVLLGRLDVFDHFTFEFNHAKQEIRVKQ